MVPTERRLADMAAGVMAACVCFLLGGFLALASLFAMADGTGDPQLFAVGVLSVGLILGGFRLLGRLGRGRRGEARVGGR